MYDYKVEAVKPPRKPAVAVLLVKEGPEHPVAGQFVERIDTACTPE
jgi:hypothetical protein